MDKYCVGFFLVFFIGIATSNDERTFTMPSSCKSTGMEFCFDKENYPVDIIEELLKDITHLVVAGDDDIGHITSYSDRQGGLADEDDCRKTSKNDIIHYIVDENGQDRVVVQMEGKFLQRFSVTWCDEEGPLSTRTTHFLKPTVQQYKLTCQNRNMNYDFLVLSSKPDANGKWSMERVKTKSGIPVCCTCRYEQDKYK